MELSATDGRYAHLHIDWPSFGIDEVQTHVVYQLKDGKWWF
jgi:hypothetical protein